MTVKTGQAWAGTFVTLDATGALATPSSSPAGVLYVDGTANAATVTITGSNPYKWAVTLPTLTAGQRVDMYITATIATIGTAGIVASEQADTALVSDVKAETAAILADTGTDGVKIASGELSTVATASSITALDGKIDTIDNYLDTEIAAILADTNELQTDLANGGRLDLLIDSIITHLTQIKGAGWTDETLVSLQALIDAIKAKTDNLPADPADDSDIDAAIAAVKSVADDILVDTGTTLPATLATIAGYTDGIAGDVWSHATRTLTVPAVAAAATEDGTTLTLYKDADINIEFTGLTIPTGAKKVVFTIKDNLDDADTAAALQATYQLTDVPAETHTLNYINSAVPPVLTTPVTFTVDTDSVEFDMTAAAAYYLPRYERGYLKWDLKLITATTVQILQQGLVQILGTSTRTVA